MRRQKAKFSFDSFGSFKTPNVRNSVGKVQVKILKADSRTGAFYEPTCHLEAAASARRAMGRLQAASTTGRDTAIVTGRRLSRPTPLCARRRRGARLQSLSEAAPGPPRRGAPSHSRLSLRRSRRLAQRRSVSESGTCEPGRRCGRTLMPPGGGTSPLASFYTGHTSCRRNGSGSGNAALRMRKLTASCSGISSAVF